jgi:hypothetical protein
MSALSACLFDEMYEQHSHVAYDFIDLIIAAHLVHRVD